MPFYKAIVVGRKSRKSHGLVGQTRAGRPAGCLKNKRMLIQIFSRTDKEAIAFCTFVDSFCTFAMSVEISTPPFGLVGQTDRQAGLEIACRFAP